MATTSWFTNAAGVKTSVASLVAGGAATADIIEVFRRGEEATPSTRVFAKSGQPVSASDLAAAVARESASALPAGAKVSPAEVSGPDAVGGPVTVTGSRASGAALTSLLAALASKGIIKDTTVA